MSPSLPDDLLQFRQDLEKEFEGRVRRVLLFGSRARGDHYEDSDWDVAVFIEGYDRSGESRQVTMLTIPYRLKGTPIAAMGFPHDGHGVSPELLANIERDGIEIELRPS